MPYFRQHIIKFTFCIFFIIYSEVALFAQQQEEPLVLTEEAAVLRAIDRNSNVYLARNEKAIKSAIRYSAWSALYPHISASAGILYNPEKPKVSEMLRPGSQLGLTASLDFNWTFSASTIPTILRAKLDWEESGVSYEDTKRKIERDIRKLFLDLLFQRESLLLVREQQKAAEERYVHTKIAYRNGTIDEFTYLSVGLEARNLQYNVKVSEEQYKQMLRTFKLLLGIEQPTPIILKGSLNLDQYDITLKKELLNQVRTRPEIKKLFLSISKLRMDRKIKALGFLPTLSLGYRFNPQFLGDPETASWVDANNWNNKKGVFTLVFNQSIDVFFPNSRNLTELKTINLSLASLQDQLDQAIAAAQVAIDTLKSNIYTGTDSIRALEYMVRITKRKQELAEEAFNSGGKTFDEFRKTELEYRDARQQLMRQKLQVLKYAIDLAYELGVPLESIVRLKEK